jgi:hypothetical protein
MTESKECTDFSLKSIANQCLNLVYIDITKNDIITDQSLVAISHNCFHLKKLFLSC